MSLIGLYIIRCNNIFENSKQILPYFFVDFLDENKKRKEKKTIRVAETYIHTYIIGHYNPSARIIDLVSHTTYVVCVHFIHKWRDLNSTPNDRFFEKLFMAILFTLRVFARNLLRGNRRKILFCILF